MAVYVDDERVEWRGRMWCHLVADTLSELHGFARQLGLKRGWFQASASYPHYDVTIGVRARALRMGALEADRSTIIRCAKQLKREALAAGPVATPIQLKLEFGGVHASI